MDEESLHERYWPRGTCFGCGPANSRGLRIKSRPSGDEVVATWSPEPHHEAFPGMLSGGIVGTLLDCHSNWTAAYHLMRRTGASKPPSTVTAQYSVELLKPTPSGGPVILRARPVETSDDRVTVEAT